MCQIHWKTLICTKPANRKPKCVYYDEVYRGNLYEWFKNTVKWDQNVQRRKQKIITSSEENTIQIKFRKVTNIASNQILKHLDIHSRKRH